MMGDRFPAFCPHDPEFFLRPPWKVRDKAAAYLSLDAALEELGGFSKALGWVGQTGWGPPTPHLALFP